MSETRKQARSPCFHTHAEKPSSCRSAGLNRSIWTRRRSGTGRPGAGGNLYVARWALASPEAWCESRARCSAAARRRAAGRAPRPTRPQSVRSFLFVVAQQHAQPLLRPEDPRLDGADGTIHHERDFLERHAFDFREEEHSPELLWQAAQRALEIRVRLHGARRVLGRVVEHRRVPVRHSVGCSKSGARSASGRRTKARSARSRWGMWRSSGTLTTSRP